VGSISDTTDVYQFYVILHSSVTKIPSFHPHHAIFSREREREKLDC